jgi:hypothetical protein
MVRFYILVHIFNSPLHDGDSYSHYLKLLFELLPGIPHAMKTNMSERLPLWSRKDTSKAPLLLAFRSSRGFIVTACCVAVFTDLFLYSIVSTADRKEGRLLRLLTN